MSSVNSGKRRAALTHASWSKHTMKILSSKCFHWQRLQPITAQERKVPLGYTQPQNTGRSDREACFWSEAGLHHSCILWCSLCQSEYRTVNKLQAFFAADWVLMLCCKEGCSSSDNIWLQQETCVEACMRSISWTRHSEEPAYRNGKWRLWGWMPSSHWILRASEVDTRAVSAAYWGDRRFEQDDGVKKSSVEGSRMILGKILFFIWLSSFFVRMITDFCH